MEKLHERIKRLRKANNLSVDEISEKLGISRATYYRYENKDVDKLPYTIIEPLANLFDVSPAYLLGWESDNASTKSSNHTSATLPELTHRDEVQIAKDLEKMLADIDSNTSFAAHGGTVEDVEDRELLRASLFATMKLAKQIAKKKFTPKKYRE